MTVEANASSGPTYRQPDTTLSTLRFVGFWSCATAFLGLFLAIEVWAPSLFQTWMYWPGIASAMGYVLAVIFALVAFDTLHMRLSTSAQLRYPRWLIWLALFVPVANLVLPFVIVDDMRRASEATRNHRLLQAVIVSWWLLVSFTLLSQSSTLMGDGWQLAGQSLWFVTSPIALALTGAMLLMWRDLLPEASKIGT